MDEASYDLLPHGGVGSELQAAREAQDLTLKVVAERTRVPLRHLAAIEQGDYTSLPAATYSSGFVRSYARLLGLDAHALSQRFRAELAEQQPAQTYRQEPYEPADPARVPSRGVAWAALLIAVVLAVGYLYWRGTRLDNPTEVALAPTPTAEAPSPSPSVQPAAVPQGPAPAPAPAAGQGTLLTAEQPVWLRVTDGETKLFQGMLNPGETFAVPATAADPRLRTSRVTALKVTVGATTIPPLGPPETLVKNIGLKPADLVARVGAVAPAAVPAAR